MHEETLAPKAKELLNALKKADFLEPFYLAGGTALALELGHRQSIDLDWFTGEHIRIDLLINKLREFGEFETSTDAENTLEGTLNGVKTSFMTFPYPLLKPKITYAASILLADALDIALMKLNAIARRNTKKDYIDLFYYLTQNNMPLADLFSLLDKKYTGLKIDHYHILNSLTYFAEADSEPMPKMFVDISWDKVKQFFRTEVRKISAK